MESRAVTQTALEQPQEKKGTDWIGDPQETPKDTPGEPEQELADVLHTHLPQCWSWEGSGVLICGQAWARAHLQILISMGKEGGRLGSFHPPTQGSDWEVAQVLQHLSITLR